MNEFETLGLSQRMETETEMGSELLGKTTRSTGVYIEK